MQLRFKEWLESFTAPLTSPGYKPGTPLTVGDIAGSHDHICVRSSGLAADYLRSLGLPSKCFGILARNPIQNKSNYAKHYVAVTLKDGKLFIYDDPQTNFWASPTSELPSEYEEVPSTSYPLSSIYAKSDPTIEDPLYRAISSKFGIKANVKNMGRLVQVQWSATRLYYDKETRKWYKMTGGMPLEKTWFKKKTFEPYFIPVTTDAIQKAYGVDQQQAQDNVDDILSALESQPWTDRDTQGLT